MWICWCWGLTKTIALSEDAYRKLKLLKDSLNTGYSDLINMLIETYRKYRVEELRRLCNRLKVSEEEVEKIVEIHRQLRNRRW